MKRDCNGSVTIEASYLIPMFLGIFALLITWMFYFHDKNVVACVAHETVSVYGVCADIDAEEVERYFRSRIRKKLILFANVRTEAIVEETKLTLECGAQRRNLRLESRMSMTRTRPEETLRDKRNLENMIKR